MRNSLVPVLSLLLAGVAAIVLFQRLWHAPAHAPSAPGPTEPVASAAPADAGLTDDEVFARSMARLAEAKRVAESEHAAQATTAPTETTAPRPEGTAPLVAQASGMPRLQACGDLTMPADVEVEYYEIHGARAAELRTQMYALGPWDRFSVRHPAVTRWNVQWRYPFQRTPSGCSTGAAQVTLRETYTLPRWIDADSAPPDLQEQWKCYLAALLVHEDGHRLHGREAAARIETLLPTLAPQPTCPEMDALANAEARRVVEQFNDLDEQYDRNTRHGITQGVVFGDSMAQQGVCR